MTSSTARFGAASRGVIVLEIAARSAAARLGLEPGDLVLRLNGEPVTDTAALDAALAAARPPWCIAVERGGRPLETVVR